MSVIVEDVSTVISKEVDTEKTLEEAVAENTTKNTAKTPEKTTQNTAKTFEEAVIERKKIRLEARIRLTLGEIIDYVAQGKKSLRSPLLYSNKEDAVFVCNRVIHRASTGGKIVTGRIHRHNMILFCQGSYYRITFKF